MCLSVKAKVSVTGIKFTPILNHAAIIAFY